MLVRNPYCQQVMKAGGAPVIIPPTEDPETIINILDSIDGIIFSGGGDFNPLWSGDEPSPRLGHINSSRDHFELLTSLLARNRQIPILGICRGLQCIAIALEVRWHKTSKRVGNLPQRAYFRMENGAID